MHDIAGYEGMVPPSLAEVPRKTQRNVVRLFRQEMVHCLGTGEFNNIGVVVDLFAIEGSMEPSGGGRCSVMASSMACTVSAVNGMRPESARYIVAPSA